jgi:ribonuclease HIII
MTDYLTIKAGEAKLAEIEDYYKPEIISDPSRPYDIFQLETGDGVFVKAYKSKSLYTIVFSGEEDKIVDEAKIFFKDPKVTSHLSLLKGWEDVNKQIGSDEVGVGDLFQGFYVCAVYLDNDDVDFINSLNVMDSKKLTDSRMEEIGPLLMKRIKKHLVRISPLKLDELTSKKWSTHMILANSHNLAHVELIKRYHLSSDLPVYIDQFEQEKIYRHYVGERICANPLIFRTKGETYYPSVATASVLARYAFLLDWKDMEETLGTTIPKGAGAEADRVFIKLLKEKGPEALKPYIKRFFRNYQNDKKIAFGAKDED